MAIARVRFTTPALAAANAHCSRSGTRPTTEAMLTILPYFCDRMTPADGAADQIQPRHVDADDPLPFLGRELVDRHAVLEGVDAGIVDQDVDPPEPPHDLARRPSRLRRGRPRPDAWPCPTRRGGGRNLGQVDIGVDHPGAVGGQGVGNRLADVPGGAGDQGHAVFQINFHQCESRGQG